MPFSASVISSPYWAAEERNRFCGALDFDDATLAGHDKVSVGVGTAVFDVVEIENGAATVEASGDCGDVVAQHFSLQHVARFHPLQAIVQGNPGAGNGGGSGAAVGLDDVAVDGIWRSPSALRSTTARNARPMRR